MRFVEELAPHYCVIIIEFHEPQFILRYINITLYMIVLKQTSKNVLLEPLCNVPYLISVCFTKSSADSIGVNIRSTVKNAAKLAV